MLVTNARLINHRELYNMALAAKGSIKAIYLHWSAGHYGQVFDDYHLNIDKDGELYCTCKKLNERKAHTYRRNTGAIGISLCCAYGAEATNRIKFGNEPPTEIQINKMAMVIAVIAAALNMPIDFDHVKTHMEAACIDGYGPGSSDPETRWDLWMIPDLPLDDNLHPGGPVLRGKANWYLNLFRERCEQRDYHLGQETEVNVAAEKPPLQPEELFGEYAEKYPPFELY